MFCFSSGFGCPQSQVPPCSLLRPSVRTPQQSLAAPLSLPSLCLLRAHLSSHCLLTLLVPPCFSARAESCAALGEGSPRCVLSTSPLGLSPTWPWGGCHGSRRCSSLLGRLLPESWGPWVCCSAAPLLVGPGLFRCLWQGGPLGRNM